MQNPAHSFLSRLRNHSARIFLGVAGMDDNRSIHFAGQPQLLGEGAPLLQPGRIVVMIVETALTHRDCP